MDLNQIRYFIHLADTLNFTEAHGFAEGDLATYDSDLGTDTSGLVSGTQYRVVVVDEFTIKLQSDHVFADGDTVTYTSDLGGSDTSGLGAAAAAYK